MSRIFNHKLFKKLSPYHLLFFFTFTILYYELLYSSLVFGKLVINLGWLATFIVPVIMICLILAGLFSTKINRIITIFITLGIGIVYNVYFIYFRIFKTTLSLYSLGNAGDALQFASTAIAHIKQNIFPFMLFFLPVILFVLLRKQLNTSRRKPVTLLWVTLFAIISFSSSHMVISSAVSQAGSPTAIYNQRAPLDQVSKNFGLITTIRLDYVNINKGLPQPQSNFIEIEDGYKYLQSNPNRTTINAISYLPPKQGSEDRYNILNIDFNQLYASEDNSKLRNMHNYFRQIEPTTKNAYTGMFAGNNLILITAESFYPYAIDPVYTPTLYQMSNEGFIFENFYNPLWGVSTTDGEYAACTGLIPKAGVWSFKESSNNYLPFTMGMQFSSMGYPTYAYHNHSYRYYARDLSHPNMGYDYKGLGNGLNVTKTWPESDIEMMDITTKEFLAEEPFHAYFMTVSGHLEYNFMGNAMARKNEDIVADAPYSEAGKAYIAANLEFDRSMKLLIERLEEAGLADNTVIAISPDHYPYGLTHEQISELLGHEVEENFELYKASFILWKKDMEPIVVDKLCASMDINPTLSNLFGLEYDSRLMIGRDIFSNAEPLIVFGNHNWLTERGGYISSEDRFVSDETVEAEYIEFMNKVVADQFAYSAQILEEDYYRLVVPPRD